MGGGLPVPLHQSTGVTIVAPEICFFLYIPIWCNIQANPVCQVRCVWTTMPCVPVGGIGVEVEVLISVGHGGQ